MNESMQTVKREYVQKDIYEKFLHNRVKKIITYKSIINRNVFFDYLSVVLFVRH